MIIRFYCVIFCILSLTSCASWYSAENFPKNSYIVPQHVDDSFEINGKFYINNSNKHTTGNFMWTKVSNLQEINLRSPLGLTIAKINIESNTSSLYVKNKIYNNKDLEEIMQQKLGFYLPLNHLHYWVQGVAVPNNIVDKKTAYGFEQFGWTIIYLQWYDNNHPKLIKLVKNELQIKLFLIW